MRRLLFFPSALLVISLALVSSALGSPSTASADVPLTGFERFADAGAEFSSDVGGVQTQTFVFASDQAVSDPFFGSFEGSFVEIGISQFDPGNPRNPRDDTFHSFFGFAELAPEQFQLSSDLSAATLNAVVTVCEGPSDCFDVSIDLTWSPTGEVRVGSGRANERFNGCKIHTTFSNSFSDATAAGTVSDGTTNFTPNASDFGHLGSFDAERSFIGDCGSVFP